MQVTQVALYIKETTKYIKKLPRRTRPWRTVCGRDKEDPVGGYNIKLWSSKMHTV